MYCMINVYLYAIREADEDANDDDRLSPRPSALGLGAQPKQAVNDQVYPKILTRCNAKMLIL